MISIIFITLDLFDTVCIVIESRSVLRAEQNRKQRLHDDEHCANIIIVIPSTEFLMFVSISLKAVQQTFHFHTVYPHPFL